MVNYHYYISSVPGGDLGPIAIDELYGTAGSCKHHPGDSGMNLTIVDKVVVPAGSRGFPIRLGVRGTMTKSALGRESMPIDQHFIDETRSAVSYWLLPRSSLAKTPLRMANSIGLIDAGYTGELIACVDNVGAEDYTIEPGTKLFQVAVATLDQFTTSVVATLGKTSRGSGGFGSTDMKPVAA